jgi:hypothetical protein
MQYDSKKKKRDELFESSWLKATRPAAADIGLQDEEPVASGGLCRHCRSGRGEFILIYMVVVALV